MGARAELDPRDAAARIVRRLQKHGHVAYFAGGCVRDELLGLHPKDYDVATDARPERVRALFRGSRYVGEAFGVALVPSGGLWLEVATFRAEARYEDGRRPSEVVFADAERDAARRDFTINGLFEDPLAERGRGAVIDYVGGRADLEAGLIRAIGDPEERFAEDHLRMVRAVRFAARFGFPLEERTRAAIARHAGALARISPERTGQEIAWTLTGPAPGAGAALLQALGLDAAALGEASVDVRPAVLEALGPEPELPPALAAWALDRRGAAEGGRARIAAIAQGAPELVGRWREALRLSNAVRDAFRAALELLPRALAWGEMGKAGKKRLLAEPHWPAARTVLRALEAVAGGTGLAAIEDEIPQLAAEGVAPEPLLSGHELMRLGVEAGPAVGRWLADLYDRQLEGEVTTTEAARAWVLARLGGDGQEG